MDTNLLEQVAIVLGIIGILSAIISLLSSEIGKRIFNIALGTENSELNKTVTSANIPPANICENVYLYNNLPNPRNPNFTGRYEILEDLRSFLAPKMSSPLTLALCGMGGVGKTQIAIEYAYRYRTDYNCIWWIPSNESTTLECHFAYISKELNLPEKDIHDIAAMINAVLRWLEHNEKWLLIFDSAQDPDSIKRFLPKGGKGHIIITSRNPNWGSIAHVVAVDVFSIRESVEFVLKRTGQKDQLAAEELAVETGGLPLALEQAGAYIGRTGIYLSDYLKRFQSQKKRILELGKPNNYPDTVSTTWDVAIQAVSKELPASADLLNLLSFFAPDEIPKSIMTGFQGQLPEPLASSVVDEIKFDDLVAELFHYSLISVLGDSISVHQLVQTVTRERLNHDDTKKWSALSILIVHNAFRFNQYNLESWKECATLLPHALISIRHAEKLEVALETIPELLSKVGLYQYNFANFVSAKSCFEKALAIDEKALGPDHPSVARDVNNLGMVLQDVGDLEGAKKCFERALAIDEKALGPDHPNVAGAVNNFGMVLQYRGNLEGAKKCFERALAIDEKALGPDHPNVARDINSLGIVLQAQGDLEGAKKCFERALAIDEKALGPDHPSIARDVNNLGMVLQYRGDPEGAKRCFERALAIDEKALGPDHPSVARDVNSLGLVLQAQGDLEGAKKCYQRALAIDEKALGPEHTSVARDVNNLISVLQDQGDLEGAKKCYQRALA